MSNNLASFKLSHFEFAHHLKHELVIVFVVKRVVWELKIPSLTIPVFLLISHRIGIVGDFSILAKSFLDEHLKACHFRNFQAEEPPELPQEVPENELGVNFCLATPWELGHEHFVLVSNEEVVFVILPFVFHEGLYLRLQFHAYRLVVVELFQKYEKLFQLIIIILFTIQRINIFYHIAELAHDHREDNYSSH